MELNLTKVFHSYWDRSPCLAAKENAFINGAKLTIANQKYFNLFGIQTHDTLSSIGQHTDRRVLSAEHLGAHYSKISKRKKIAYNSNPQHSTVLHWVTDSKSASIIRNKNQFNSLVF